MKQSRYDQYIEGNRNSLNSDEKEGILLFFGKGRCNYCHNGNLFSDFNFHSIGVPQGFFGFNSRHRDIGRASVTTRGDDLYKFRTPPLIDVISTSPYGHNGAFTTLCDVVMHHINPIKFYIDNPSYYKADYFKVGKLINSRDKVLRTIDLNKEEEIYKIIQFLGTL